MKSELKLKVNLSVYVVKLGIDYLNVTTDLTDACTGLIILCLLPV